MIVPRHVLGRGFQAPSDLVNIAGVGISGMGAANAQRRDEPEHRGDLRLRFRPARRQAGASGRAARRPRREPPPQRPRRRRRAAPPSRIQGLRPVEGAAGRRREVARRRTAPPTSRFVDEQMPS